MKLSSQRPLPNLSLNQPQYQSKLSAGIAHGCLFSLVFIQLLPNIIWLINCQDFGESFGRGIAPCLIFLFFIFSLFRKPWAPAIILGLLAAPALAEAWYIAYFGNPSSEHLLGILFDSDKAEISSYLAGIQLKLLVAVIAPLPPTCYAALYYFRHPSFLNGNQRRTLLYISMLGGLAMNLEVIIHSLNKEDAPATGLISSEATNPAYLLDAFSQSWPLGLPARFWNYWQDRRWQKEALAAKADFRFGAQRISATNAPIIVLVIGETSRPDHWQLFGYSRETTPRLKARHDLLAFNNVTTPWAWTRMSVPLILTQKPPETFSAVFSEPSFISAFNEAGFNTYWLSTQNVSGLHENTTSSYAHEAINKRFINPSSYKDMGALDTSLLPILEEALSTQEAQGKLLVLHTLGSHFNYTNRYPGEFRKFLPDRPLEGSLSLHMPEQQEMLVNSYDNSILMTDYLLSETIRILEKTQQPAALVYLSDHGENLRDEGCQITGHGQETEHDFRIPLLFWASKEYIAAYPEKISAAKRKSASLLQSTMIFPSILDLADITLARKTIECSIFSNCTSKKKRWVFAGGGLDFDTAKRSQQCKKLSR